MGISSRVPNTNEEFLQTTIQTLKNKFGPDNVKVTYYSLKGLEEAVKAGLHAVKRRDVQTLASRRRP